MSSDSLISTILQSTNPASLSIPDKSRSTFFTRPSTSATSSSGFAALGDASISSFGTASFPSKFANQKSFEAPVGDAGQGGQSQKATTLTADALLNASKLSSARRFGTSDGSAASTLGPAGFTSLGSGVFGTGFGQAFNGGTKLSSFAAPMGDAKLGDQDGLANQFGSAANDEEEENSDSEENGVVETEKNDESSEVNFRFQHQDGKLRLIFSPQDC